MKKAIMIFLAILMAGCAAKGGIKFIDMSKQLNCLAAENNFIANTNADYQKLEALKWNVPLCSDFNLPPIDFEEYTLLGSYAAGTGCTVDFEKQIIKNDELKTVTYKIDVVESGLCEELGASMNWILVPKIPSDYSVAFEVS